MILDCYRLAYEYKRPPGEFLSMTIEEIGRHMYFTARLIASRQVPPPGA